MALAATKCWFIWKERCLRVFEKQERTPEQLVTDISRHFAYWHPQNLTSDSIQNKTKTTLQPIWKFPTRNSLKLNCDASWISKDTNSGFGCILRNHLGTGKGAAMGVFRASTAEEAEALALLHTTKWAIQHNMQNLVIEGDNQATINYLQGHTISVQWQSIAILEEVKSEAAKLISFLGFTHVDMRANKVADLLAKKARKENNSVCWLLSAPLFLILSIAYDSVKAQSVCNDQNSIIAFSDVVNSADSATRGTTNTIDSKWD
ncbi:uncharacterized protein LOC113328296 [Papaver somniferum]|uniref:uncharacterized protein LOC113328296 n=1 Tax=Papaver somniferum TaxID=3469 RepID=UPI000E6FC5C2|nr:uncharacterized protein LOC113328296 [Papaver somniferum]